MWECGDEVSVEVDVEWRWPHDGVPLSGVEAEEACLAEGMRLCRYEELCPHGSGHEAAGLPSDGTTYFPFYDEIFGGRRWIDTGCHVHEEEHCGNSGGECCDHGWCSTPGRDDYGYKGLHSCCPQGEAVAHSTDCGAPRCNDWERNGDEAGVDCGGSCEPCPPSCDDGLDNNGEDGVDCGGPCEAACGSPQFPPGRCSTSDFVDVGRNLANQTLAPMDLLRAVASPNYQTCLQLARYIRSVGKVMSFKALCAGEAKCNFVDLVMCVHGAHMADWREVTWPGDCEVERLQQCVGVQEDINRLECPAVLQPHRALPGPHRAPPAGGG